MKKSQSELLKALAITAELCGTEISAEAAAVMADDLAPYPLPQLVGALKRCRMEVKGRLTVAEIVSRLDDGRPGPDEAWALCPQDEAQTTVWTDEIAQAFVNAALPILHDDHTAARFAFRDAYVQRVRTAREAAEPVRWVVSLGHNKYGREAPLKRAVECGRLSYNQVSVYLPDPETMQALPLFASVVKRGDSPAPKAPELPAPAKKVPAPSDPQRRARIADELQRLRHPVRG